MFRGFLLGNDPWIFHGRMFANLRSMFLHHALAKLSKLTQIVIGRVWPIFVGDSHFEGTATLAYVNILATRLLLSKICAKDELSHQLIIGNQFHSGIVHWQDPEAVFGLDLFKPLLVD